MDFLDPEKQRRSNTLLFRRYILIGILIIVAVIVALFLANGYWINKDREIIQKGLVFVSSTPKGSQIFLDGKLNKAKTNTRLDLPEDTYQMEIKRTGYRSWQREIAVGGGSVVRYDYPFLFPIALKTVTTTTFDTAPTLATESPNRRWLVVQQTSVSNSLAVIDLTSAKRELKPLSLPATVLSDGQDQSWKTLEWADDNVHLLVKHSFNGTFEYVLINREQPNESLNLTKQLAINPVELRLFDKKFDSFVAYDADKSVQKLTLKDPRLVPYLRDVLAFQTYSNDTVLYVTTDNAPLGKVTVRIQQGTKTFDLKQLPVSSTYVVDITKYSGDWFTAVGATSENKVYIYKNPSQQLSDSTKPGLIAAAVLRVNQPNHIAFSSTARFIMAENGASFAVYDAELKDNYHYVLPQPLDAAQDYAHWMDGHRLSYVSKGSLYVFDYDSKNLQKLMPSSASYMPFFDQDYKNVYSLSPSITEPTKTLLTQTPLRTPEDQ